MWGDFPDKLAAATGLGVFAYSRQGYGQSSPATLPRPLDFMHVEAREVLPRVLDAIGFRSGVLVGHSDGASIAAIYAGSVQDHRVRGLVLMAPHFIVEDVTMAAIRRARESLRHAAICARGSRAGTPTPTARSRLVPTSGSNNDSSRTGICARTLPISACRS